MQTTLLKNKNYLLYLFGNNTSIFGDILLMTGFSLYIMTVTQSAMQFGISMAIAFVPRVLLSPFSGAWVDKLKKRQTVIILDLIRGLWLVVLWLFSFQAPLSLSAIYASLVFFAICDTFFGPAFTTILPRMIPQENLSEANAISNTTKSITTTLSPLVATLIFSKFGIASLLLLDAATFLVSAVSEYLMRFDDSVITEKRSGLAAFGDVLSYTVKDLRLSSLLANGNLTHFFLFPFIEVGIIYLLIVTFKAPAFHFGIVESSYSAGAIFSGIIALSIGKKRSIAQNINLGIVWMLGAVLLYGIMIFDGFRAILMANAYMPVAYFTVCGFVMFMAFNFYGVYFGSYYQSSVPQNMLGRFTSLLIMTFAISRLLGMLAFGALFESGRIDLALYVLLAGMALKLLVHVPFLKEDHKIATQRKKEQTLGTRDRIG